MSTEIRTATQEAYNATRANGTRFWREEPPPTQTRFVEVVAEAIARLGIKPVAKPPYYVTAERPPTREDANSEDYILAYHRDIHAWRCIEWDDVVKEPDIHIAWIPQPPAPISADDAAFDKWIVEHRYNNLNRDVLRGAWQAALAHRDKA